MVGPSGSSAATKAISSSPRSRSETNSSIASSLTPRGSTLTAGICELWMWIDSPSSVRSFVRRSETSSTTPCSSSVGTAIVSPTAYQRSENIAKPAMMSVSTRWTEKPTRISRKDAPASAASRSTPPISSASASTAAAAKPA